MTDQFTDLELVTLRGLVHRYFEIKEYGLPVWGRRFYDRLSVIAAKIYETLANVTGLGLCKDEFTYIDMRILLNMVQSEGLRWAKNEAPDSWNFGVNNVPVISENTTGLMMTVVMLKLHTRVCMYR